MEKWVVVSAPEDLSAYLAWSYKETYLGVINHQIAPEYQQGNFWEFRIS